MESPVLSEAVEREARRVAVALGLEAWTEKAVRAEWTVFSHDTDEMSYSCHFNLLAEMDCIAIDGTEGCCEVECYSNEEWRLMDAGYEEVMARALYRLGFDDQRILAELNEPLTAHEKLELRLSMPREFWPQAWLDELEAPSTT